MIRETPRMHEVRRLQRTLGRVPANCFATALYVLGFDQVVPSYPCQLPRNDMPVLVAAHFVPLSDETPGALVAFYATSCTVRQEPLLFHMGVALGSRRMFHQRKTNGEIGTVSIDRYLASLDNYENLRGPYTYDRRFFKSKV